MTRPSLHEAATASFEGLANAVSADPQREAYRRGAGSTVARPGRGDCADVVAGARLHHAAARWTAEGYFAPAARGHQRRPTATCDAALDRRAAAGAVGQRFGGEFVSVGMDLRGERCGWRAAQQPLQILVCRASLASASSVFVGLPRPVVVTRFGVRLGAGASFSGPRMISRLRAVFRFAGRFSSPGSSFAVGGSPNPSQAIGAPAVGVVEQPVPEAQQPVRAVPATSRTRISLASLLRCAAVKS